VNPADAAPIWSLIVIAFAVIAPPLLCPTPDLAVLRFGQPLYQDHVKRVDYMPSAKLVGSVRPSRLSENRATKIQNPRAAR